MHKDPVVKSVKLVLLAELIWPAFSVCGQQTLTQIRQLRTYFRLLGLVSVIGTAFWVSGALASTSVGSNTVTTERTTAQLIPELEALVRGQDTAIALKLTHRPHWHSYWRNPGDSGLPTSIEWDLPDGIQASDIQWPTPEVLPFGPLVNYGYEGGVWLISDIRVPKDFQGSEVKLLVNAEWLVCKDVCIPEKGEFILDLPVVQSKAEAPINSGSKREFADARAAHPVSSSRWKLEARETSAGARLKVVPPSEASAFDALHFFPFDEGLVEPSGPQTLSTNPEGSYTLAIPRVEQPLGEFDQLSGVLVAHNGDTVLQRLEIEVPIRETQANEQSLAGAKTPPKVDTNAGTSSALSIGLAAAIMLAFAGGMILNLMPCVFPVLSIKLLGFAQSEDLRQARRHGLLYATGVIVSFWLLAGLLLGLRAAGQELGWGFQLQSPFVVISMAALFFMLALNLAGLFEIGQILPSFLATAQAKRPNQDAVLSGVLAVAVASPCTGPFMGVALAYAISQPSWASFAVFTSLGVGMALPYVLLAWFPAARRLLPRPGPWMERFKQFLSFPLFATVIWLAWVLGVQLGMDAVIYLLVTLLLLGMAVWMGRQARTAEHSILARGTALTSSLGAIGIALWLSFSPVTATPTRSSSSNWDVYSTDKVRTLNAEGKTVFVDFTAAWCVTCQFNKRTVLDTDEMAEAFADRQVATLRADWTSRDPHITRALDELGRNGVPVYLIQRPDRPPVLLPELLTKNIVIEALNN